MMNIEVRTEKMQLYAERGDQNWRARIFNEREHDPARRDYDDVAMAAIFVDLVKRPDFQRFTVVMEDTVLLMPRPQNLVCFDLITGKRVEQIMSDAETEAIMSLAIGGDEHPRQEEFYKVAQPAIEGWDPVLRPIP